MYNRNRLSYTNYERQQQFYDVGDILQPIQRKNAGWHERHYRTLDSNGQYAITGIRSSKRGHQLLTLEAITSVPKSQDGSLFTAGYDARNFKLIKKGDGTVNVTGNSKKNATWIIVNSATGQIVGSIPLTEAPATQIDPDAPLLVNDPVHGTAQFLNRFGDVQKQPSSAASYTEKLVDDKIAELLRKDPEGSYMAFKHVKTGQLPKLPVQWITA